MIKDLARLAWGTLASLEGELVTVRPQDGRDEFSLVGIFNETSVEIDLQSSVSVRSEKPSLGVFYGANDRRVKVGDMMLISQRLFRAHEALPDGQGGYQILLQELN